METETINIKIEMRHGSDSQKKFAKQVLLLMLRAFETHRAQAHKKNRTKIVFD